MSEARWLAVVAFGLKILAEQDAARARLGPDGGAAAFLAAWRSDDRIYGAWTFYRDHNCSIPGHVRRALRSRGFADLAHADNEIFAMSGKAA